MFSIPTIDRELIAKYNLAGPRYTSYPTALQFSASVDQGELLADSLAENGPLSLYVHLPFCESLCWFCACTTVITNNRDRADDYLDYLELELRLYRAHMRPGRFGGAFCILVVDPRVFLTFAQLQRLMAMLRANFTFAPNAELSIELDPRTLDEAKVALLAESGFNRASFGVQDVNPDVQRAVHRIQPSSMNRECIGWIRKYGIRSLNVDLIYGLPLQTVASFGATLDEVISYQPDRLAVFSYAHVPWVAPAQKILERQGKLPGPDEKLSMLELIIARLTDAGYVFIGMDHFAKADDSLAVAQREGKLQRNFQGYSTHAGLEICAFGMSSISQTSNSYRQNFKDLEVYQSRLAAGQLPIERGYRLSADDKLRRTLIMRLMCDFAIDFAAMSHLLNVDFKQYFRAELLGLQDMQADGLLLVDDGHLEVTAAGRLLIRNIAMRFDAHWKPAEKRHAKTI
ncbi:MAG: oxygen-independent coproporphyrinogen III oxidase [Verrucomicrobia bacterium]|nr:oxygen-independent coproporphyrinogen III oxidase [Verrucomicrobiota bacterium]